MDIKKISLSLMLMAMSMGLMAQHLHVITNDKGKLGYADENGDVVIKCKYQVADEFRNGVARVSTNAEEYGFINEKGKVILPLKYNEIRPFDRGTARVRKGEKWGLIDDEGHILLKPEYDFLSEFNCYGKAWVNQGGKVKKEGYIEGGKYGIADINGKICIPLKYARLMEFGSRHYDWQQEYNHLQKALDEVGSSPSYVEFYPGDTLETDCQYVAFTQKLKNRNMDAGLLGEYGEVLVKEGVYTRIFRPGNGIMGYYKLDGKKISTGYYNLATKRDMVIAKGKEKIKDRDSGWKIYPDSVIIYPFRNSIAVIQQGVANCHFIDARGNQIGDNFRKYVYSNDNRHKGLYICDNGKTASMVDFEGNILIPFGKYQRILFYDNRDATDLFPAKKDGRFGVIDRFDHEVVPFEYDTIFRSNNGIFVVKKNGKYGYVSSKNEVLVPPVYTGLSLNKTGNPTSVWVKSEQKLWRCYDIASQKIVSKDYLDVEVQDKGKYAVAVLTNVDLAEHQRRALSDYYPTDYPKANRQPLCVLVNEQGEEVFVSPFPMEQAVIDAVIEAVEANGGQPIPYGRAKSAILKIGSPLRKFTLDQKISENEWDF